MHLSQTGVEICKLKKTEASLAFTMETTSTLLPCVVLTSLCYSKRNRPETFIKVSNIKLQFIFEGKSSFIRKIRAHSDGEGNNFCCLFWVEEALKCTVEQVGFWHVLICHFLWASFTLLNIYYLIQKSNNSNAVTFLWLCSLCRVITCDECLKAHWTQLESLAGEKMIKMILTCLTSSPRAIVKIFHCQDHSNRISNLKAFNYKIKSFHASKNN